MLALLPNAGDGAAVLPNSGGEGFVCELPNAALPPNIGFPANADESVGCAPKTLLFDGCANDEFNPLPKVLLLPLAAEVFVGGAPKMFEAAAAVVVAFKAAPNAGGCDFSVEAPN